MRLRIPLKKISGKKSLVAQIGQWWNKLPDSVFNKPWKEAIGNTFYELELNYSAYQEDLDPQSFRRLGGGFVCRHIYEQLVSTNGVKGKSQTLIGRALGVPQHAISRWKNQLPEFDSLAISVLYHTQREFESFMPRVRSIRYKLFAYKIGKLNTLLRYPVHQTESDLPDEDDGHFLYQFVQSSGLDGPQIYALLRSLKENAASDTLRALIHRALGRMDLSRFPNFGPRTDFVAKMKSYLLPFILVHVNERGPLL